MADTKRNHVAGRVATPKSGGAPTVSPLPDVHEAIAKASGAPIEVTTAAPESKTYEGTLLVADPITNLVVLETRVKGAGETAGRSTDYRVLAISRIRNFQIMSLASGDVNLARPQPQISEIDLKRLHKRCDDRVAALKEQERNRGKGVTTEGQALFDALRKINVHVRWHNQEMIVHDVIIVAPPYRPEDCRGAKDKQEVLIRVKKALEGERKKLQDKEGKTAVVGGLRKGG